MNEDEEEIQNELGDELDMTELHEALRNAESCESGADLRENLGIFESELGRLLGVARGLRARAHLANVPPPKERET